MLSTILIAAAPILMIGLIVWVFIGVARDVKKGKATYFQGTALAPEQPIMPPEKPTVANGHRTKLFLLGLITFLFGAGLWWYSYAFDTFGPGNRWEIHATGIMIGGIIFIIFSFKKPTGR